MVASHTHCGTQQIRQRSVSHFEHLEYHVGLSESRPCIVDEVASAYENLVHLRRMGGIASPSSATALQFTVEMWPTAELSTTSGRVSSSDRFFVEHMSKQRSSWNPRLLASIHRPRFTFPTTFTLALSIHSTYWRPFQCLETSPSIRRRASLAIQGTCAHLFRRSRRSSSSRRRGRGLRA
jgi:hypothetical protein